MPRAGLTRAGVVELGVLIADASAAAWSGLTLAAVAARAGVAVPSLYKHVSSLAELRGAIALVGIRELARSSAAATVGLAGPEALRELGRAMRRFASEHPGLYAAAQAAPDPDGPDGADLAAAAADAVAVAGAVLRGFGLAPARTVDAVRTVRSGIHGFIALEAAGGFGMPDDVGRSFEVLLDTLVVGIGELARR